MAIEFFPFFLFWTYEWRDVWYVISLLRFFLIDGTPFVPKIISDIPNPLPISH